MSTLELCDAVEVGDIDTVRRLVLEEGVNVNDSLQNPPSDKFVAGKYALHIATECNNLEIVQFFLDKKANIDCQDGDGRTPLHVAICRRGLGFIVAKLLLQYGADVNIQDLEGRAPLHLACRLQGETSVEMISMLIAKGANVNARSRFGTPLLFSITPNRLEGASLGLNIMQILLDHGADVSAEHSGGITIIHRAADGGQGRQLQLLINHNADVNARTKTGKTPLHLVSSNMRCGLECMQVLLKHGADIVVYDRYKSTPLHSLVERGSRFRQDSVVAQIRLLLDHLKVQKEIDLSSFLVSADIYGKTAFHYATKVQIARTLLEQLNSNGKVLPCCYEMLHAKDNNGMTLLQYSQLQTSRCDPAVLVYLKSFTDDTMAVSMENKKSGVAVRMNPSLNDFQSSLADQFFVNLSFTWQVPVKSLTGESEFEEKELPDCIKFVVMGYLAPSDVMKREPIVYGTQASQSHI